MYILERVGALVCNTDTYLDFGTLLVYLFTLFISGVDRAQRASKAFSVRRILESS